MTRRPEDVWPHDWAPRRNHGQETQRNELADWLRAVANGSIHVSRRTTLALLAAGGLALVGAAYLTTKALDWLQQEQREPLKAPRIPSEISLGTSQVTLTTVERTVNDVIVVNGAVFRTDPKKPDLSLGDRYNVVDPTQILQIGFADPSSRQFHGIDWPQAATTLSLTINNLAIVTGQDVDGTAEVGRWGMLDLKMRDGSITAGYFYIGAATQEFVSIPFGGLSEVTGFHAGQVALTNADLTQSTLPSMQVNTITMIRRV